MTSPPPDDSPDKNDDTAADAAWQRSVTHAALTDRQHYFMVCAAQGQMNRMAFLRAHDPAGMTQSVLDAALVQAAGRGQEKACRQLLGWGASARHDNSQALLRAVKGNHGFVTDLLLRRGARIDDSLKTPPHAPLLSHAIEGGNALSARALVLHGARPHEKMPFSNTSILVRAREVGMTETADLMARLWPLVPSIPTDFATRLPLETLRGVFASHSNLTGFQLAAYHGQIDGLLARLTANGRHLQKTDLISATPRHPQTVLFILGARGDLARVFEPTLWGGNLAAMRDLINYVPAAFLPQLEDAGVHTRLRQAQLQRGGKPGLRLKPR